MLISHIRPGALAKEVTPQSSTFHLLLKRFFNSTKDSIKFKDNFSKSKGDFTKLSRLVIFQSELKTKKGTVKTPSLL